MVETAAKAMVDTAARAAKVVHDEVANTGRFTGGYTARDKLGEHGERQEILGRGERELARAYADYGKEQQNPRVAKLASEMENMAERRVKLGQKLSKLAKDDDKKWQLRIRGFLTGGQCVEAEVQKAREMDRDFDRLRGMKDELDKGFGSVHPPPSYEKAQATAEKQSYYLSLPIDLATENPPPYSPSRSRYEEAQATGAEHSLACYGYDPRAMATAAFLSGTGWLLSNGSSCGARR